MAFPSSGNISLDMVAKEFGGEPPHSLNEYYGVTPGVPTSGKISLSDFYGKASGIYINSIERHREKTTDVFMAVMDSNCPIPFDTGVSKLILGEYVAFPHGAYTTEEEPEPDYTYTQFLMEGYESAVEGDGAIIYIFSSTFAASPCQPDILFTLTDQETGEVSVPTRRCPWIKVTEEGLYSWKVGVEREFPYLTDERTFCMHIAVVG